VNGVYDRTGELSGGQPVSRKQGRSETWIHYWPTSNEWIVANTESKGNDDRGWARIAPKTIMKVVSTQEECETEFQAQRSMYAQLLCGVKPRELIPDALASIVLTHDEFFDYMQDIEPREKSLKVVQWIYDSASKYNLKIHIMFMDFLESYNKSLFDYIKSVPVNAADAV
jgi:hypothetical protein